MANRFGQSIPTSSAYFRAPEQSQSNADARHPRTGNTQRDAQYEAILSKIKDDIDSIRSQLRERTTTAYIASEAIWTLQQLEDQLLSAMNAKQGWLKKKRSLRNLSKSILRLMTKAKVESGIDPTVAAEAEAEIMAQFKLDSRLAMQNTSNSDFSESIQEASRSAVELPGQTSTYREGYPFQAVPSVPQIPARFGGQSSQQSRHKLTSKSTTSLSAQGYHTSSREPSRSGDSQDATLGSRGSPLYAYPQGHNPVRQHESNYGNRYHDNPEQHFRSEAGGQNWDPRYAPQNYDERSYEASRVGRWEQEQSNTITQPHGRHGHSTDTRESYTSYETYPGTSETLTTMEFEDRSEIESQDLHGAAVGEDSNEVRPRARAGVFCQTQGQGQWPGPRRF